MPYRIRFTAEALDHLRGLRATDAAKVVDQCRRFLTVNPTLESKARIKRLTAVVFPPYRMRVDDLRVFYSVEEQSKSVDILAVVHKPEADAWLARLQGGILNEAEDSA